LIKYAAENPRFKDIQVSNYVKDPYKNEKTTLIVPPAGNSLPDIEQFSAVTFSYTQNSSNCNFVAFTGTNGTTDGWAEDVAMLYTEATQAQLDKRKIDNGGLYE